MKTHKKYETCRRCKSVFPFQQETNGITVCAGCEKWAEAINMNYLDIQPIENIPDNLVLVTDSQDVEPTKAYLGPIADEFDSFFVGVSDGDYTEVWGFFGTVAYSYKTAYKIL